MTVHVVVDRSTVRGLVAGEARAEMARSRVTISQLPELLGKSQSYWSRRINGEVALDVEDLAALAALLRVPASTFWCAVRDLNPQPADLGTPLSTIRWAA